MAKRIITTDILEEDVSSEKNLRPQTLEQYIGQEKAKENLKVISKRRSREAIRWIMSFSMDLRDLERRRLPVSLPMRWG